MKAIEYSISVCAGPVIAHSQRLPFVLSLVEARSERLPFVLGLSKYIRSEPLVLTLSKHTRSTYRSC